MHGALPLAGQRVPFEQPAQHLVWPVAKPENVRWPESHPGKKQPAKKGGQEIAKALAHAKSRCRTLGKGGRRYPNLVDNMRAAAKKKTGRKKQTRMR
jgi:hypothetical protein